MRSFLLTTLKASNRQGVSRDPQYIKHLASITSCISIKASKVEAALELIRAYLPFTRLPLE